ncbi:MAG: ribonuclease catalytic domain-containing protein [Castellaniella sp.]
MTLYVFYEDGGSFKAEKIFSRTDASLHVESESGKRSKIKRSSVLFEFDSPAPAGLLSQAQALAAEQDIDFIWECAPQDDIDAAAFAEDYFGHPPSAVEKAAIIYALHSAPAYFHRRGKGRYRPAPPDILKAALAAIEKKQQREAQQAEWTRAMVAGELPEALAGVAPEFLGRPDKASLEWKAFDAALSELKVSPEQLLLTLKVWPHPLALLQHRFLSVHFPKGTQLPPVQADIPRLDLPMAEVTAYSVDDSQTTEIDDALSVRILDGDRVEAGVHIAVPALAVTRGSKADALARKRMATVYMPGERINMLPQDIISAFSLQAGEVRPVLSLYVQMNLETGEVLGWNSRLENIRVADNLHHSLFAGLVTPESLDDPAVRLPHEEWLRPLWRVARHLMHQRELMRGRPEGSNRIEFSIELDGPADDPDTPVRLVPRERDAPLDLIVAEFMILANNLWGGLLHEHGLPGIYRSQQAGRVRMSTHPLPHEAIGVPQYAWSTSPLRRYVDLINQSQILAAAEHGVSARLVAPFKPSDADLFAIISGFDTQYGLWKDHQIALERYWTLRWFQQQGLGTVGGTVLRDDLVRLDSAPLVVRVPGLPPLERGEKVNLDILGVDELGLELHCRLREVVSG